MYVLDPFIRAKLENALQLEPQERGYEVLLIEPCYKTLLKQNRKDGKEICICPLLLTFLDLYHFPLRGQEQAEFIAQRASELKRIYKNLKHKRNNQEDKIISEFLKSLGPWREFVVIGGGRFCSFHLQALSRRSQAREFSCWNERYRFVDSSYPPAICSDIVHKI